MCRLGCVPGEPQAVVTSTLVRVSLRLVNGKNFDAQ